MKQKRRDEIADKLETHLKNVLKLEKEKPGSLDMRSCVEEGTLENGTPCGTVCCMVGWLPATFPETYKWKLTYFNNFATVTRNKRETLPHESLFSKPLGIKMQLLEALAGTSDDEPLIGTTKNYKVCTLEDSVAEVKRVWNKIIKGIRNKDLDKYLYE